MKFFREFGRRSRAVIAYLATSVGISHCESSALYCIAPDNLRVRADGGFDAELPSLSRAAVRWKRNPSSILPSYEPDATMLNMFAQKAC